MIFENKNSVSLGKSDLSKLLYDVLAVEQYCKEEI
jgi:hypothetical protein